MTVTSFAPGQTIKVEPIEVPEGGHVDDKGNIYSPLGEAGRDGEAKNHSPYKGETEGVLSISQVSQRLGFEYPQHFVRFFKALTGKTPTQWRAA